MLTREETIKAFECCYMTCNCKECPLEKKGNATSETSENQRSTKLLCTTLKKTSLHLRQQAQARRYQKIPITYNLMIAQKSRFVKHMIPQTKPVQIYSISMRECRHVSVELLISEKCTEKYAAQGISLKI